MVIGNVTVPRGYTFVPPNAKNGALVGTRRSLSIRICWNAEQ